MGVNAGLTVTLVDAYDNPAPGQVITFESANLGGGSVTPATDSTDSNGQAASTISSTLLGVRPVTATVSSNGLTATRQITFVAGPPAAITLTIVPGTLPAGSSAQMTATVEDAYGNVVASQDIGFSTTDDLGSGDINPDTDATDSNGAAASVITSTVSGVKTVRAEASNGVSRTAQVTFTAGTLDHFVIGTVSDPQTAGVGFTLLIMAQDQYNNLVDFTGQVTATDSTGTISPALINITNGGGSQSVVITRAQTNVTIVITNTAGTESGASNAFDVIANEPGTISLQIDPVDIPLQGSASLTATITDDWGNAVADGTVVTFTTSFGTVDPATDTTSGGQAESELTADCTERTGVVVTATAGTALTTTMVNFTLPGAPQDISIAAAPSSIAAGSGTAIITATLTDCGGNGVPGETVSFAASLGTLPGSGATDANGVVTVTLSAGTVAGTSHITATADSLSASTMVVIEPGTPFTVTVTANPSTIRANGYSTSSIRVDVSDQYGNAVSDDTAITLDYSPTALGTLTPLSITTTNGSGSAVFTADVITGTVTISATSGSAGGSTLLTLIEGFYHVYLPVVARNYSAPSPYDLLVESVSWIPSPPTVGDTYQMQIVIRNDGTMTVSADFWVDLYLNPSSQPGVNQTWNMLSQAGYGKAWLVRDDIGPGQTLTLLTSDPDDPSNPEDRYSNWPPPLFSASHEPFYVLVDSWGESYGLVDEGTGEDNNLWGAAKASELSGAEVKEMRRAPGPSAPSSGPRPPLLPKGGWAPRLMWWG